MLLSVWRWYQGAPTQNQYDTPSVVCRAAVLAIVILHTCSKQSSSAFDRTTFLVFCSQHGSRYSTSAALLQARMIAYVSVHMVIH